MRPSSWFALVSLGLVSPAAGSNLPPHDMVAIPETALTLGIDLDGIVSATEQCTQERKGRACEPEEFVIEQSSAQITRVARFYLDKREVSLAEYDQCVRGGRCKAPPYEQLPLAFQMPNLPVVLVSQSDAVAYCDFRDARLPTEAEFEAAARGSRQRTYPWGFLDHRKRANSGSPSLATSYAEDGYDLLAPVTAFVEGQSPEGVLQLAGNVAEWTSSDFGPHGEDAPPGKIVVKGGSFARARVYLRATARIGLPRGTRTPDLGFRCARSTLVKSRKSR